MECYTREQIEKAVKSKGYVWFNGSKDFDVNIVGVRNMATGLKITDLFDDCLTISYKENGQWKFYCWTATTDPGKRGMLEGKAKGGVARLVPGQYRKTYAVSMHAGKYQAVCQRLGNVTVWRDGDRDLMYDEVKTATGMFGINIHRSNPKSESKYISNWSEGCQVFKKVKDFNEFMKICKKAVKIYGNHFTYTLIESTDIK